LFCNQLFEQHTPASLKAKIEATKEHVFWRRWCL